VLTPIERWKAAMHPLSTEYAAEVSLTAFTWIVLIISVMLLFRVIARHRRTEHYLKQEITKLTTINVELRQEIDKLYLEQVEILEDIIDAEPPDTELLGFNPQEMRALSELAKRLS
jgi:hypothetical protein